MKESDDEGEGREEGAAEPDRLSTQEHEERAFAGKMRAEFPNASEDEVRAALDAARNESRRSEDRELLTEKVRAILRRE